MSPLFGFAAELPPGLVSLGRGISALVELAGGKQDEFALPEGIKLLESLSLREISTTVDPTVPLVRHLQFAVESSQVWTITEQIQVTQLGFGWLILFPFNSDVRSVSASLYGQLKLGKGNDAVRFDVTAHSHGGFSVSGSLHEGDKVHLTRLIGQALGKEAKGLPEWDLTKLAVEFDTRTKEFTFEAASTFELVKDKPATIDLYIHLIKSNQTYQATVKGSLTIAGQIFEAEFDSTKTSKSVLFKWTDKGWPLRFEDIAKFFDYSMAPLPENLDLTLAKAEFYYDFTAKTVVVSAQSKGGRQILFASLVPEAPPDSPRLYLFELDVPLKLELKDLPVIGDKLPAELQLGIEDLQVMLASDDIADLGTLNSLITEKLSNRALIPTKLNKGLTFAAMLQAGTNNLPMVLPLSADKPPDPKPLALATTEKEATPNYQAAAKWFEISKSFGPVSIERIGVQYEASKLFFLLDASLGFSALNLEMSGLGVGSSLQEVNLVPHLDGISVSFSAKPVTINGGLRRVPPRLPEVSDEYSGHVTIAIDPYLINGIAAYAKVSGQSSFFLFAQVTGEFGGPPAFFITGIAAGFGYNRSLTIPTIDQLPRFPLVAAAMPTTKNPSPFGGGKATDPVQAMEVINDWVYPALEQNWLAAGIKFTSFKILESFALLTISFGNRFEIALLGLSSLTMPPMASKPIGYAQLALEVTYAPDDGLLKVAAQLTPESYILSEACHLTGGFAFYIWFKAIEKDEVHAGDFVVSLGGYSPYFKKPAGYPSVPRVGANWKVSDNLTIKGGFYFALTPVAVMAGGELEANFVSGNFKAWFTAKADFLLYWEPFHYLANLSLSLGASYTLGSGTTAWTITVHVGVDVTLHGPPFGGTAVIDLYIFSIAIDFGPTASAPKMLTWEEFKSHYLLPKDQSQSGGVTPRALVAETQADTICFIRVSGGLIKELPPDPKHQTPDWIVNPEKLEIVTSSKIPCSEAHLVQTIGNQRSSQAVGTKQISNQFGVTACGIGNGTLTSVLTITWHTDDGGSVNWEIPSTPTGKDDILPAVTSRLPRAAWFKDTKTDPTQPPSMAMINGDRVTDELTTGFTLKPTLAKPDETLPIKVEKLEVDLYDINEKNGTVRSWTNPTFPKTDDEQESPATRMAELAKVDSNTVREKRAKIVSALQRQGKSVAAITDTQYLAFAAQHSELLAAPILCSLGSGTDDT